MDIVRIDDTRHALVKLFAGKGFKSGAEVGVDRGLFSEEICKANPEVNLFCIDPWAVYDEYADIKDWDQIEKNYDEAVERLKKYNCFIIRQDSESAVLNFKPKSLDFVYIDGNHAYDYVLRDANLYSALVKPGGIVSGHDYTDRPHPNVGLDVKRAITDHLEMFDVKTLYVYTKRGSSTWFYYKQ